MVATQHSSGYLGNVDNTSTSSSHTAEIQQMITPAGAVAAPSGPVIPSCCKTATNRHGRSATAGTDVYKQQHKRSSKLALIHHVLPWIAQGGAACAGINPPLLGSSSTPPPLAVGESIQIHSPSYHLMPLLLDPGFSASKFNHCPRTGPLL